MEGWDISGHIGALRDMADSLKKDLGNLDPDIEAVDFDAVVRENLSGCSSILSSVDSICVSDDRTFFIEFKAARDDISEELKGKYRDKAVDSVLMVDDFIDVLKHGKRVFFLVHQDPRYGIAESLSTRTTGGPGSGDYPLELLKRYHIKDKHGNPVIFDEIDSMSCRRFVKVANSLLKGSTREALLSQE